ncbi:MAG: ABC transporter permease, partial [Phycisphaerales bacterium]|nr:ABC transporter permease [Phycisphaerales bacterium]
ARAMSSGDALGPHSYATFLLPGAMTLVAVFASIFSSIAVIEERNQGWLQSVLVAPVPRWSIALGKIGGGAAVAFVQAVVLLLALPVLGATMTVTGVATSVLALALTCLGVSSLGFVFAWRSETTAGFHAVMNLVFVPLWMLSGAFFPVDAASPWLAWLARADPLTWCTAAIREPLAGAASWGSLAATAGFAAVMFGWAVRVVARPRRP